MLFPAAVVVVPLKAATRSVAASTLLVVCVGPVAGRRVDNSRECEK
jgi:hypothetical protein